MRARSLALIVGALALLVAAAPASAANFTARLDAPNHSPKAGTKSWKIKVTAKSLSGKPLRAQSTYKFLFNGQVVSTQNPWPGHPTPGKNPFFFTGSYRDTILWPARAVDIPLTFRVVVAVKGKGSINLDWKVRVRR